jgi:hypothetical protein
VKCRRLPWALPALLRVTSSVLQQMSERGDNNEVKALLRSSINDARPSPLCWRLRGRLRSGAPAASTRERRRRFQLSSEAYGLFGAQFDEPDHRAARRRMREMGTEAIDQTCWSNGVMGVPLDVQDVKQGQPHQQPQQWW